MPSPRATSWRERVLYAIRIVPVQARRSSELSAKNNSRKGAKAQRKTQRELMKCFASFFAPLRLCARNSSCSPVPPNRFALLQKRFYAFVRVLSLHQLVQVNVLLLGQHGVD